MKKNLNFIVLTCLFFGLGFITVLNDLLTPILKNAFALDHFQANFVAFAFFIAYFVGGLFYFLSSLMGVRFFVNLGYKGLILLGLSLSALGCLIFIPAALCKNYVIFLLGLFSIGFGFAFLQISANPLVLVTGEQKTAASRLNLVQGFNSLATTLAPILGVFVFYQLLNVNTQYTNLKYPYFVFALFFVLLALLIRKYLTVTENSLAHDEVSKPYALNHLNLIFGAWAIFFYVGSEVSIGTNFIALLKSSDTIAASDAQAGALLAFYWGGAMIGRFLGGIALGNTTSYLKKLVYMVAVAVVLTLLIVRISGVTLSLNYYIAYLVLAICLLMFAKNSRVNLLLFALVNIVNLFIGAAMHNSYFAIWAIIAVGIFNSVMWSNIFDLAIDGLGKYKEQGSAILIMMILGGAILPIAQGKFADVFGIVETYYIPIIGYGYILLYAIFYSKKTLNWIR